MSGVDSQKQKRVLLFGKTGQGKSTIANMLVSGKLLKEPLFPMGDGLIGVTQSCIGHAERCHYVIDTVGLGEDPTNRGQPQAYSRPEDAIDPAVSIIYNFLENTRGEYSHILYVKAADRFDQLDREIFTLFTRIFKGCERAFGVIVTKCHDPDDWRTKNEQVLKQKYKPIPEDRYVYVDFPPLSNDEEMENLLVRKRAKSLATLDDALDRSFVSNSFRYFKPDYVEVSPQERREMAKRILFSILKDIWQYVKQYSMVSVPIEAATKSKELLDLALSALGGRIKEGLRQALLTPELLEQIGSGNRVA